MAYPIFKEQQSYRGTWVMYLILMVELPSLILVSVLVLNEPGELNDKALTLTLILSIMMLAFFFLMSIQLNTRIDDTGIHYRYFPFIKWRTISKDQIHEMKVVQFNPLSDHGGWGIKGNRSTKAYTVIGHHGLEIDLGEKKKVLIGTQKEKELRPFLEYWKEENHG
ncbi:hypothetical protein SAMN04487988_109137 [Algoriphagus hitonicola]|uniref:Uncharacterized protein n=2 Tax=Algoriphagus hitonicola TaxID=435880 RepID=A0A1I2VF72_9BACT|nr:hypothetical protein SAMN04487988_109137 [Algoriphagus hitonicola]